MGLDPLGVGDILQQSWISTWQAQRVLLTNTWIVANPGTGTDGSDQLQELADFFASGADGTMLNLYLLCLSSEVTCSEARVQKIKPIRTRYFSSSVGANGVGGLANTGNVATVGTLVSDLAGRDQVGNKHVGPIPADTYAAGAPTNAQLIAMGNFMNQLKLPHTTLATSISIAPILFHRATGLYNYVTQYRLSTRVGTLRRRTLRVGE